LVTKEARHFSASLQTVGQLTVNAAFWAGYGLKQQSPSGSTSPDHRITWD